MDVYFLDKSVNMGGINPSDDIVSSQKAIKNI